jgi:hypothetical protein
MHYSKKCGEATMSGDVLDYSHNLGWHSITETLYIRMSDATFQRHVEAYLEQQGITEPTLEQKVEARQHCRRVSFWDGCNDPDVHKQVFGQHGG